MRHRYSDFILALSCGHGRESGESGESGESVCESKDSFHHLN
jgi:hypothetical protein